MLASFAVCVPITIETLNETQACESRPGASGRWRQITAKIDSPAVLMEPFAFEFQLIGLVYCTVRFVSMKKL
jgi:hypothetical protein